MYSRYANAADLYDAVVVQRSEAKTRKCLKAKVSPDYCTIVSSEILSLTSQAIIAADDAIVELLLQHGADLSGRTEREFLDRANVVATAAGRDASSQTQHSRTSSTASSLQWNTPLHVAVTRGSEKMLRLLLDRAGADPNVVNSFGIPPVYYALHEKQKSAKLHSRSGSGSGSSRGCGGGGGGGVGVGAIDALVEQLDRRGLPWTCFKTSIEAAARMTDTKMLEDLLRVSEFSLEELGVDEQQALYNFAAARSRTGIALLLSHSADIDAKSIPDHRNNFTAFMEAAAGFKMAAMLLLLDYGADIDAQDSNGCTALVRAAMAGHRPLAEFLLQQGADTAIRDHDGWNALHAAMVRRDESVARLLLDAGSARVSARSASVTKDSLLHVAARNGSVAVTRHVLSNSEPADGSGESGHPRAGAGATVDALNHFQETPLSLAAANGHRAVVQVLLSYGAAVDIADSEGHTPLWHAARRGNLSIVAALVRRGVARDSCVPSSIVFSTQRSHGLVVDFLRKHVPDINFTHEGEPVSAAAEEDGAGRAQSLEQLRYLSPDQQRLLVKQGKLVILDQGQSRTGIRLSDPFEESVPPPLSSGVSTVVAGAAATAPVEGTGNGEVNDRLPLR